jgi:hypothetical protein
MKREREKERERERELAMTFGQIGREHNTSNPEETMERTIQCSHLDAHGPDSQLLDSTVQSNDDKVLLAP